MSNDKRRIVRDFGVRKIEIDPLVKGWFRRLRRLLRPWRMRYFIIFRANSYSAGDDGSEEYIDSRDLFIPARDEDAADGIAVFLRRSVSGSWLRIYDEEPFGVGTVVPEFELPKLGREQDAAL